MCDVPCSLLLYCSVSSPISLSDFKVDSQEKPGMVMSNYLKGKYGALPYPMIGESLDEEAN